MTNRKPIDESTLLEEIRRYLKSLRCTTMAGELANMLGDSAYGSMSHLQWVHHLVKTEVNQRTYTRTIRYLRESGIGLGDPSDLDRIQNPSKRGIDTSVLGSFKTGEWLEGSSDTRQPSDGIERRVHAQTDRAEAQEVQIKEVRHSRGNASGMHIRNSVRCLRSENNA